MRPSHAPSARIGLVVALSAVLAAPGPGRASDHADPIDPWNKERLEGGITDLFVFPVLEDGKPAFPFERKDGVSLATPDVSPRRALSPEERAKIKRLVVVLCVRRALTETGKLSLGPYTYRVHMDTHTTIDFNDTDDEVAARKDAAVAPGEGYMFERPGLATKVKRPTGSEARARYGGRIPDPKTIGDDVVLEFTLKDDASLREFRTPGLPQSVAFDPEHPDDPGRIQVYAGVRDDPFIFPAFFQTNIVAMVATIPIEAFGGKEDWLIWATSHKGARQVDQVGRSLRTQNPRFEFLNTLPPREHAEAVHEEHHDPSLMRDLALRFNIQSLFAYRAWDQVPDVMVFTTRFPVGFPNGRLLTDDVAALLAQHGDTLLLELSHHVGGWPRRTTNDKEFQDKFPYLADPWPDRKVDPPPGLSTKNRWKLAAIGVGLVVALFLEHWAVAYWYHRRKLRRRHQL
jgi:hypothetical protein